EFRRVLFRSDGVFEFADRLGLCLKLGQPPLVINLREKIRTSFHLVLIAASAVSLAILGPRFSHSPALPIRCRPLAAVRIGGVFDEVHPWFFSWVRLRMHDKRYTDKVMAKRPDFSE